MEEEHHLQLWQPPTEAAAWHAGCAEVQLNILKSDCQQASHAVLNFLLDHLTGHTDESLQKERTAMEYEIKKKHCNMTLISSKMDGTFSLRRRDHRRATSGYRK